MSFLDDIDQKVIVGPEGSEKSPIAIVGEAPGADEIAARRPFIGKSGRLLEMLLGTAGLSRSQCYFTNIVKERPKDNRIEQFIKFPKKGPPKTTPEYERYESDFLTEISRTDCNVIVPTGNVSLYALTRLCPPKITARRGSMYGLTIGNDTRVRKIIPTIHPSAALRLYMYRIYIMKDLKLIRKEMETPDLTLPVRNLHIFPSYYEIMQYIKRLENRQDYIHLAFDIEVSKKSKEMTHISLSHDSNYAMSICLYRGMQNIYSLSEEWDILNALGRLLENPAIPKLAHNGSFDSGFVFRKYGWVVKNMDDTMIVHGIIHPDMPKDLGFVTSTRTREPYYKDDGGKLHSGIGVADEVFSEYSAKDSAVLIDAWPSLQNDLKRLNNDQTYQTTKSIIEPLLFMSHYGTKVDVVGRDAVAVEKEEEKKRLTAELCEMIGQDINPDSTQQVQEYFYVKKGIKPYTARRKQSDGSYKDTTTADVKALKRIALKGFPEASIILDIRGLTASISKYWRATLVDNRLKCFFNPIGAADTGRLSSSKTIFDEGMNKQNQPHDVKQFYIADDGYLIGNLDYSQAENRCVAYFAPEYRMIEAFETGIDVHARTGSYIFGIPEEEISREKGSTIIGGSKFSQRDIGKHANHGFNYGQTAHGFALHWLISLSESNMISNKYHAAYPGVQRYWQYIRNELQGNRKLTNPLGRTRLFSDRMGDDLFNEGYAYMPQSTVASMINMFGLIPFYYNEEYKDLTLLGQVHDSIEFQIPLSIGWEAIAKLILSMKRQLEQQISFRGQCFTIPVDLSLGFNLGKYDDKDNPDGQQEVDLNYEITTITSHLRSLFEPSALVKYASSDFI